MAFRRVRDAGDYSIVIDDAFVKQSGRLFYAACRIASLISSASRYGFTSCTRTMRAPCSRSRRSPAHGRSDEKAEASREEAGDSIFQRELGHDVANCRPIAFSPLIG